MSLLKKVLLAFGIIIFILVSSAVTLFLLLPSILGFFAKDIAPIDDKDLLLTKVEVSEKKNAYQNILRFEKEINLTGDDSQRITDHLKEDVWDGNFVEKILAKNSEVLADFDEASQRPIFQAPELEDPAKISIESVVISLKPIPLIKTAKISSLKAISLSKKGKDKEAFDEAFKSIGLGQKIQDSQGNLIYYLIGLAIKTTGLETLQKILETSKADNQTLDQYLERLGKYEDNKTGLSTALKVEYLIQKNAADSVVEGSSRPSEVFNTEDFGFVPNEGRLANNNFYFKPNKTKKLFAGYIRGILNDISKPCGFVKEKEPKRLTPLDKFKLIFTENAIGKIVHDLVVISLGSIHNRRCDGDLAVSGTKLLIAIKMYKNDKNSYPATINDLMPLYLTEIPKDPYNGESMRYSSGKKLIYSVGKDLQDSGGTKSKEWSKAADPSFEIGF